MKGDEQFKRKRTVSSFRCFQVQKPRVLSLANGCIRILFSDIELVASLANNLCKTSMIFYGFFS